MSVPLRQPLTTFKGAWLKLGSCADIWISSVAKGSDLIDGSKLVHLPGSRCTSEGSSSSANSADASDGRGDGNASRSGSFDPDMVLSWANLAWCMPCFGLPSDSGHCTAEPLSSHNLKAFAHSRSQWLCVGHRIRSKKQTGAQSCRESMFGDITSRRLW